MCFPSHLLLIFILSLHFVNGQPSNKPFRLTDGQNGVKEIVQPLTNSAESTTSSALKTGTNDWSRMCHANVLSCEYEQLFPRNVDKYVFPTGGGVCGGLGNQMFRFAALYGIGKPYGRKPIYKEDQNCQKTSELHATEGEDEMEQLFPIYACQLKYINSKEIENDTFYVEGISPDCCTFGDPEKHGFSKIKAKYIEVKGKYFLSYKFFETRRWEIRQIFQFGQEICKTVEAYKTELFQCDQTHKFCVHIRLGDFKDYGWETKTDFTEKGIEFGIKYLENKFGNVSIVLLGEDKKYLFDLKPKLNATAYVPKAMPRGNDMAFATTACDSLLITASQSTFSWWMAYLMPDNATVFYDSDLKRTVFNREIFLPEWKPIQLVNGIMTMME